MTSKFTFNARPFIASNIIDSLSFQNPPSWEASRSYTVGDRVTSNNKIYIATNSGLSGSNAPTHTSGTALNGSITWLFMSASRQSNLINSNLYLALGGTKPWQDENNPPEVGLDDLSLNEYKNDLLTLIRLNPANLRLAIKKHDWVSGLVYDQYDASLNMDDMNSYVNPFYTIARNLDIYKCISNNNGAQSTIEPTGRSLNFTTLSDGYTWKYMGSIDTNDASQFITPSYIPVSVKTFDDGSDQWKVQQAARSGSISSFGNITQIGLFDSPIDYEIIGTGVDAVPIITKDAGGTITTITMFDGGSGYDRNTRIVIKEEIATGSGAKLEAVVSGGSLNDVQIITGGLDYVVQPSIFLIGDGTGAEIGVTLNATDGSITSVNIINAGIDYTYMEIVVVAGNHAAIADAILAPANGHGFNIVTELGSRSLIIATNNNTTMRPYLLEGAESTFRQTLLISSALTKKSNAPSLMIGSKHPQYGSAVLSEFDTTKGFVLFCANAMPNTRSGNQEEYVRIVMTI